MDHEKAESMTAGGTVLIRLENTIVESPNSILATGRYIDIAVRDQGVGIPNEHRHRWTDGNKDHPVTIHLKY